MINFLQILIHLLLLRPFAKFFLGFNISGRVNLEGLDNHIIISNHNSHIDILLLFCLLPCKAIPTTHPVADREYFSKYRIVFRLVKFLFNPIWITRGRPIERCDPFQKIREKLDSGCNIIIFPEGTRGKPGEMLCFKSGIGRLAKDYPQIPITPVFLQGPEKILPKKCFFPLPFQHYVFVGPPQRITGPHRNITQSLERILRDLADTALMDKHTRNVKKKGRKIKSIAFLGIDGSGKSTLSRSLAKRFSAKADTCLISDSFHFFEKGELKNVQPLLSEKIRGLISRRAKKAKSLKWYKIPKMAELLLRNHLHHEACKWYNPDLIFLDGSTLLNMVAWAALYKEGKVDKIACSKAIKALATEQNLENDDPVYKTLPELKLLKRLKIRKLILPDIVLFLDLAPAEAVLRINSRGEQKQVHETEEKLSKLRDAYLMVCEVIKEFYNVPVCIMDGRETVDEVEDKGFLNLKELLKQG